MMGYSEQSGKEEVNVVDLADMNLEGNGLKRQDVGMAHRERANN